jgi:hypothetical protein
MCVKCKGRLLCGEAKCRLLEKNRKVRSINSRIGTEFVGTTPPSVFIAWNNYPKVDVAPLSLVENDSNAHLYDTPEKWFGLDAERIIGFRESLVRPYSSFRAKEASEPGRGLSEIQEAALGVGSLMNEVSLKEKPREDFSFSEFYAPMGPKARMKKFRLVENPKVPKKADYLSSDTDAKANDALYELYSSSFETSYLSKVLSVGAFGVEKNRRLVPTRWAITAVDSNMSARLINEKVKGCGSVDCYKVFHSEYLDNNFYIMLMPGEWSFEQLEGWMPGGFWTEGAENASVISDHEFYRGRKDYASEVTGAYYAGRLAVAEYLCKVKKQASALVFREIGKDYTIPLGVWVIRTTVKNALEQKPTEFSDLNLALEYLAKNLTIPLGQWKKQSALLDRFFHQKRIIDFFP